MTKYGGSLIFVLIRDLVKTNEV